MERNRLGLKTSAGGTTAAVQSDIFVVGDVKQSILTDVEFANLMGANGAKWVLADGRAVTGSMYETLTGNTHVPDLRGTFLRMAGNNATNIQAGMVVTSDSSYDYKTARSRAEMRAYGSGTTVANWCTQSRYRCG